MCIISYINVGDYWMRDLVQLEKDVLASGGAPPPADALTINGQPGPNYNCSTNGEYSVSTSSFSYVMIPFL